MDKPEEGNHLTGHKRMTPQTNGENASELLKAADVVWKTSAKFLDIPASHELFQYAARRLHLISGKAIVAVTAFDPRRQRNPGRRRPGR